MGTSCSSSCSTICVGVLFSNGALLQFVESNQCSQKQPELFGTLLVSNSVRRNPILVLEASFGDKRHPVGVFLPCYLFDDFI